MRQDPQTPPQGGASGTGRSRARSKTPASGHWHLPADTEPHERLWMSFPRDYPIMAESMWELSAARRAWTRVAHAAMDHEPVTMLVDPADRQIVHTYVDPMIPIVPISMDHPFLGLTGPTFLTGDMNPRTRRRQLGMIDWVFNGFGRRPDYEYRLDDVAGGTIADLAGARRQMSLAVNEGGAFITDGEGTLIASESVLLDPARNPGWTKQNLEDEFKRYTDIRTIIWLPGGLTRQEGPLGLGGHIDQLVSFPSPGTVLLHWQENPSHPDHEVSSRALQLLQSATDARGRRLNVATVTAPLAGEDARGPVAWSYINVLPLNGAVVVPSFDDPHDDGAHQLLAAAYPGRTLIPIPARRLYQRGVGIRHLVVPQPSRRVA